MDRQALPRRVKLQGRAWKVQLNTAECMQHKALGLTFRHQDRMVLDADPIRSDHDIKLTLLHEVVHAIRATQGRSYQNKIEEDYADSMAAGFLSLIQDNPRLIQFLQEKS